MTLQSQIVHAFCRFAMAFALFASNTQAQSADPNPSDPQKGGDSSALANPVAPSKTWIVRDPTTGRVYQQQLVPVSVPITRWEPRTIEQTVYEPNITTQIQKFPQTTYVPNTQYVMQPKITGRWNPFKQPVQAYQYVPVTNWVPQTQQVSYTIPQQQWVPRQQKVVVYQQVQATEVRQQLVQTEIPQPSIVPTTIASIPPRQPIFRLPILAQQRLLPWAAPNYGYSNSYGPAASTSVASRVPSASSGWQPVENSSSQLASASPSTPPTGIAAPISPNQYANIGLRPVANPNNRLVLPPFLAGRLPNSPYSAPLQSTTTTNTTASRDTLQSGMQPTVLR